MHPRTKPRRGSYDIAKAFRKAILALQLPRYGFNTLPGRVSLVPTISPLCHIRLSSTACLTRLTLAWFQENQILQSPPWNEFLSVKVSSVLLPTTEDNGEQSGHGFILKHRSREKVHHIGRVPACVNAAKRKALGPSRYVFLKDHLWGVIRWPFSDSLNVAPFHMRRHRKSNKGNYESVLEDLEKLNIIKDFLSWQDLLQVYERRAKERGGLNSLKG